MAVRMIADLGFVAHTERHSSVNSNIHYLLEHKEVAQWSKLGNWKVPPPAGHAYCYDSVLGDRRYHDRPGRRPDLRHLGLFSRRACM